MENQQQEPLQTQNPEAVVAQGGAQVVVDQPPAEKSGSVPPGEKAVKGPLRKMLGIVVLLIVVVGVAGGGFWWWQQRNSEEISGEAVSSTANGEVFPSSWALPPLDYPGSYDLVVEASGSAYVVRVVEKGVGNTEVGSLTITDLYVNHYHTLEFHQGYLYAIRRIGFDESNYNDNDWIDELWRYGLDGSTLKILSAKGLDFRAAENNSHVAVVYENVLALINSQGEVVRQFGIKELTTAEEGIRISPVNWSGNTLRGEVVFSAYPQELFVIDVTTFTVHSYSYPEGNNFVLNPVNLWAAYSTMPIFFDSESAEEYSATNPTVRLKLYNFDTQETIEIESAVNKRFRYSWLNERLLEYSIESDDAVKRYEITI